MIFVICMKANSLFENKEEVLVVPGDVLKFEVRITQPGYLRLQFSPYPLEERTFKLSYEI